MGVPLTESLDDVFRRAFERVGVEELPASKLPLVEITDAGFRADFLPVRNHRLHLVDEHAKGRRGYEVPLNTRAMASLKALVKIRADMGYGAHPDQPLVMSRNHRGMSVRSYQARMAMWVAEAGLQVSASPHWLRHTLAKRVMARSEARDPQGIVQVVLGQRSRESTVIYTLPDRETVEDALELAR